MERSKSDEENSEKMKRKQASRLGGRIAKGPFWIACFSAVCQPVCANMQLEQLQKREEIDPIWYLLTAVLISALMSIISVAVYYNSKPRSPRARHARSQHKICRRRGWRRRHRKRIHQQNTPVRVKLQMDIEQREEDAHTMKRLSWEIVGVAFRKAFRCFPGQHEQNKQEKERLEDETRRGGGMDTLDWLVAELRKERQASQRERAAEEATSERKKEEQQEDKRREWQASQSERERSKENGEDKKRKRQAGLKEGSRPR
eukprot:7619487-Karenia_brevis.AAC.1